MSTRLGAGLGAAPWLPTSSSSFDPPSLASMKLLIFGGSGFVGSAICKSAVARGWQVVSCSRKGESFQTPSGHIPAWAKEVHSAFSPPSAAPDPLLLATRSSGARGHRSTNRPTLPSSPRAAQSYPPSASCSRTRTSLLEVSTRSRFCAGSQRTPSAIVETPWKPREGRATSE